MINKKIKGNAVQSKNAFSLIELSIVILILSVLASSGLAIFKSTNAASKTKTTKDRIDTVYKAIGNYLLANRRLPCPARLDLTNTDTNYGISRTCISESGVTLSSSPNSNLVYGMVPTKTLNLPSNMAEDAFGTKLSYIIDKRFAVAVDSAGTIGFEGADPKATNMMTIKELSASGSNIITDGIMLIISHGPNKFGGFNSAGVVQNDLSTTADEKSNTIDNSIPTPPTPFDNIFITNSSDTTFDDILIFKNKTQLAIDAGLESMLCRNTEANYLCNSGTTSVNFNNSNYGEQQNITCPAPCSNGGSNSGKTRAICDKYGIWNILYKCI